MRFLVIVLNHHTTAKKHFTGFNSLDMLGFPYVHSYNNPVTYNPQFKNKNMEIDDQRS